MWGWLKKLIRKSLDIEAGEDAECLDVQIDGRIERAAVLGFIGLSLRCAVPDRRGGGRKELLVSVEQAVSQKKFWKAWNRMGGSGEQYYWEEDGEPFTPE